jgi:hypothetical protein
MNFNNACSNLQINTPFSDIDLKKAFRIMALKYHPDKHIPDTNKYYANKFRMIHESYEYLNTHLKHNSNIALDSDLEYNNIFSSFLSSFFSNNLPEINIIIQTILNDCRNLSIKLFEDLEKENAIEVFEFINTYQYVLYISKETVDKIKEIVNKKIENDNIIIINPSLHDLLSDNIYVLEFEDEKYFIPLWHDEIYYKNKKTNNDIVIKCIPELPDNISLDNNNNLIINVNYFIKDILNTEILTYSIETISFDIIVNKLKIQNTQQYLIKDKGISLIQPNDIYDNTRKGNVIFIIHLQ